MEYAKSKVEDLTRLCVKVDAPIEHAGKAVKMSGFTWANQVTHLS